MNENKNLFNYVVKSKNASKSLTAFYSLRDRKIIDGELNETEVDLFRAGYIAALEEIERQKKEKSDSKNHKFNIFSFLDDEITKEVKKGLTGHLFMSGVYHDSDNKKLVATNGRYLVFTNAEDIPECFKNQIVNKDNAIVDGRFPNWLKVIPDFDITMTEVDDIKEKILTCNRFLGYKTQLQAIKDNDAVFIDGLAVMPHVLYMVSKFITTQNDVKIYRSIESWSKSWVIKGDSATMVFMPCRNIDEIMAGTVENKFKRIYDSKKNTLVINENAA